MIKLSSFKRGAEGGGGPQSANICIFSSQNEISIQLAALWTLQVPWFHRCKPFKKMHLKKNKKLTASSRFTVAKVMTSYEPRRLFVYRGRSAEWLRSVWVNGAVKKGTQVHTPTGLKIRNDACSHWPIFKVNTKHGCRISIDTLKII